MSKRVWHKGPPPHVGWWNANWFKYNDFWRWWDGQHWSFSFSPETPIEHLEQKAHVIDPGASGIEWTHYWPKNARVPRIKP